MELALNLGWLAVALFMVWLWLRSAPGAAGDRRVQLVALALVIVILLPAISMTDDLLAAQNPAEVDTCLRRDHDSALLHAVFPAAIALAVPLFASLSVATLHWRTASALPARALFPPAMSSIDNRPPPLA